METTKVGMREFRDNLASYASQSETAVSITRHGDTIGYFIPAVRERSETEKEAFRKAAARWQAMLDAAGVTEEDAAADFEELRAKRKR